MRTEDHVEAAIPPAAESTWPPEAAGELIPRRRPRLGFVGVGWIGRHRMEAVAKSDLADITAIAEPDGALAREAGKLSPSARIASSLDALLDQQLDGVVIATPSALHAEQAKAALERGLAVFCQKPLGRTEAEVRSVVEAARKADRLLGVDLSYRHAVGMRAVRERIASGALGRVFAARLVFHNAYGPDKPWFYDPKLSGGGCLIDLGIHLVDLALWALDFPKVEDVSGSLYARGAPLGASAGAVEDYATARVMLEGNRTIELACSWKLSCGQDAVIEATFHGTEGAACFRNVNGSFYDFTAEHYRGTAREVLHGPPDAWGGRAAVAWARKLAMGEGFDPEAERLVEVSRVLDRIYGRPLR